ncbi:MAG: GNAT family N-acetyltransferase [Phycisphaerales bacterium]|nr:GNAT family N-acetyltransferase [Phycisphaerales bacterium]
MTRTTVRLFTPGPGHAPALAKICFEAFGTLQDRHRVERDFASLQMAEQVMGMLVSRPDFFGVAAELDGQIVGSNFLQLSDAVAGVGPITVSPGTQARGIGRLLMEAVLNEARRRGVHRVRLQQEAINTASLSLYTRLGFIWREACVLMRPGASAVHDPAARAARAEDLPAIAALGDRVQGASRRSEVAGAISAGMPASILEREGRTVAYHLPGFFGHGFAETQGDLLRLIGQSMRGVPDVFDKIIVPLSQFDLHAGLLERGGRSVKLFNYMTVGPFHRPEGGWVPSIGC